MRLTQLCFAAIGALAFFGAQASAQIDTNLVTIGNINTAGNWDNGLPGAGQTGLVNIDSAFPTTAAAGALAIGGTVIFGDNTGAQTTLTAVTDIVAGNPEALIFNNVTANVGDDIFTGANGNFIFNAGSITNVDDDFEANAGGTITVNGGTHNVGVDVGQTGFFGAQNNSTLNFFGGTVDAVEFRNPGGNLNVGGDAALVADILTLDVNGNIDFSSAWTGNLDVAGVADLSSWFTALSGTTATFDGVALTQAVFDTNFQFDGTPGAGLSLIQTTAAIPEPSSLAVLGLGVLGFVTRRRRS